MVVDTLCAMVLHGEIKRMNHKPRRGAGRRWKWITIGLAVVSSGSLLLNLYVYRADWLLFVGFLAGMGLVVSGIYLLSISA